MARTLVRDSSEVLGKLARKVFKKEFPILKRLNFLFLWKLGEPDWDDEGFPIAASARKLPVRERDIYGYDVEVKVFRDGWRKRGKKSRYRLIYHELRHVHIEVNEDFKVLRDKDGRVKFQVVPHDVVVRTFEDEIKKFGINPRDVRAAQTLSGALKKRAKH